MRPEPPLRIGFLAGCFLSVVSAAALVSGCQSSDDVRAGKAQLVRAAADDHSGFRNLGKRSASDLPEGGSLGSRSLEMPAER
jgi:hypothetical protein